MENTTPKSHHSKLAIVALVVLAVLGLIIWQQYSDAVASVNTRATLITAEEDGTSPPATSAPTVNLKANLTDFITAE